MDKKTEALKLAQDWYDSGNENHDDFANMIKQVIALAEQPAQPSKPWAGLTDEERGQAINANFGTGLWAMAKDIEAKLKEKNS